MAAVRPRIPVPEAWDRAGLPAWTYFSEELLEVEKEALFRRHWQLVCHIGDLPGTGDFVAFDVFGERALVVRDESGRVRAFHNVCRHRGSRVVAENRGTCASAIVCPFHGWSYHLDGTLRGPAQAHTLPALDPVEFGLKPIEIEVWHGFVFVRFKPGPQPAVSRILGRFEDEVAPYRLADAIPAARSLWTSACEVNWKAVRDVDNEGYHVPRAHPALQDLYGDAYYDEPLRDGASRSFAPFNAAPGRTWSVGHYQRILPEATRLPESHRRAWLYIGLFPNSVLALYPDSVKFYQEFPISARRSLQRGSVYRWANESRRSRVARYLSDRIDRMTGTEDRMLTVWSAEAALSSGFDGIILSDLEYNVRAYHDAMRAVVPVLDRDEAPAPGTVQATNEALRAAQAAAPA